MKEIFEGVDQDLKCKDYIQAPPCLNFYQTALSAVNDATASPPSAALQTENSFCVIWLKVNVSAHQYACFVNQERSVRQNGIYQRVPDKAALPAALKLIFGPGTHQVP